MDDFRKMLVYGVSFDVMNRQPIVLLKVEEENRFLPIWIGHPEAASILMKLQNTQLPRPMTHDLVTNILTDLSTTVDMVMVTELKASSLCAVLRWQGEAHPLRVPPRPSDAIALAGRPGAPLSATATLLE